LEITHILQHTITNIDLPRLQDMPLSLRIRSGSCSLLTSVKSDPIKRRK